MLWLSRVATEVDKVKGAIGRGGAPLGKGDGGFRKKVSPLYKGQYGAGGIPHSMKWKREIGGKGWRFVKKLAKNLVVS